MLSLNPRFRNRKTTRCDTQIGNDRLNTDGVSPKIARRRGVTTKHFADGRQIVSTEWGHGWATRRTVLRLLTQTGECVTQSPTNIGGGGGRRRLDFAGPQAAGEVCQQDEREWTADDTERENNE